MILLIDNYDSFVFNLARYFAEFGCETQVFRNDAVTIEEVRALKPKAIVVSPGPCTPSKAGVSVELIRQLAGEIPLLGVCLGHQAIVAAFGGAIVRAPEPVHGKTSEIHHEQAPLFDGMPQPFHATRYHSLIAEQASLPAELAVTARTAEGLVMAIEHRTLPVWGVQFHPESILTGQGRLLLGNWLSIIGIPKTVEPPAEIADSQLSPRLGDNWPVSNQPLHW